MHTGSVAAFHTEFHSYTLVVLCSPTVFSSSLDAHRAKLCSRRLIFSVGQEGLPRASGRQVFDASFTVTTSISQQIQTFRFNHPQTWDDPSPIEKVEPRAVLNRLGLEKGEVSVITGGPPCQGFSINAPERFLQDPRNALFRHYLRFLDEFEPQALVLENVPGMLSRGNGHTTEIVTREFEKRSYRLNVEYLYAAHYGVPQERWRLIVMGSRLTSPTLPEPTHFAAGRANFRGGKQ